MNIIVSIVESKYLNKIVRGLAIILGLAAAVSLFTLILITASDVLSRELLQTPIPGAIQYSELLLVGVTLLALADGQRNGDHVAMELVTSRLPLRAGHLFTAFGYSIACIVLFVASWMSLGIAIDSFQTGESRIGIVAAPAWPARAVVPLGFFVLALMMLLQTLKSIAISSGRVAPDDDDSLEYGDASEGI